MQPATAGAALAPATETALTRSRRMTQVGAEESGRSHSQGTVLCETSSATHGALHDGRRCRVMDMPTTTQRAMKLSKFGAAPDATPATWPDHPTSFGDLLTPVEAAQYLRLDQTGVHSPHSAVRTLNYWRDRGELKATKYARRVWFRRGELDRFLERKTEE